MDVGDPSNFARILDLYGNDHSRIASLISGTTYSDGLIAETMADCHRRTGYLLTHTELWATVLCGRCFAWRDRSVSRDCPSG